MPGRFQELYRLSSKLYIEGSPVIIEAGALQKDKQTGKILAQIKIKNISPNIIVGCKVFIRAFELSGEELQGIDSFSYLDISVARGGDFGTKVPVFLPNDLTRKFSVAVTEVLFNDNTMWKSDSVEWKSIPKQNRIESVLQDTDLIEEYKIEAGDNAEYYPEILNGLFLCTCGNINMDVSSPCFRCHRKYDALMRILDADSLRNNSNERLEKEKKEQYEQQQIRQKEQELRTRKRKAIAKKIEYGLGIIIIFAIIFTVLFGLIIPSIKDKNLYKQAMELFEDGQYLEAKDIFEKLGDYKDSENMVKEVQYCRAEELFNQKDFYAAKEIWEALGDYADSVERLKQLELNGDYFYYQKDMGVQNQIDSGMIQFSYLKDVHYLEERHYSNEEQQEIAEKAEKLYDKIAGETYYIYFFPNEEWQMKMIIDAVGIRLYNSKNEIIKSYDKSTLYYDIEGDSILDPSGGSVLYITKTIAGVKITKDGEEFVSVYDWRYNWEKKAYY